MSTSGEPGDSVQDEFVPATTHGLAPSGLLRRIAKLGAWNVVAYVVTAGSGLAINVVVGRKLGPERFGEYSFYIWIVRTCVWLLALGIPPALIRLLSEHEGAGDVAGARGTYRVSIRYTTLLMPMMFAVTGGWVWLKSGDLALTLALASAAVLLTYVWLFEQTLGGLRRYDLVARNAGVVALAQIVSLAIIAFTSAGLVEFLFLYSGVALVSVSIWGLVTSTAIRKWPIRVVEREVRQRFRRLSGTMAVVQLSDNILWGRPEIFFLEHSWTHKDVGLYSAALVLQTLTVYLPHIASRVLTPEFAWLRGGGRDDELARAFPVLCILVAFVAIPLGVGGSVMAGRILSVAYGQSFAGASITASILMGGGALIAIAGPASSAAFTGDRPVFMAQLAGSMAVVNVVLDALLIPKFGPRGAATATITSQCAAVMVSIYYVRTRMQLKYPWAVILKLAAASLVASEAARLLTTSFGGIGGLAAAVALATFVYVPVTLAMRVIPISELKKIAANRRHIAD